MRPEFAVCIPETVSAVIGILAVTIAGEALYKDLYWQYRVEEIIYFQPFLTWIEENSSEHEHDLLIRDMFYQVVVILFTAPTVIHLLIHIALTLSFKYDDDNNEEILETPEEDPDYIVGTVPELVFPSPNHLHSYELIQLEPAEADDLLARKASAFVEAKKKESEEIHRKPRFRIKSLARKLSKERLQQLAKLELEAAAIEKAAKAETEIPQTPPEITSVGKKKKEAGGKQDVQERDKSRKVINAKHNVRIKEDEAEAKKEPVTSSVFPPRKKTTSLDKPEDTKGNLPKKRDKATSTAAANEDGKTWWDGAGILSWFETAPSTATVSERPLSEMRLNQVKATKSDLLKSNLFLSEELPNLPDELAVDQAPFLNPRMCKLILLAAIIFESLLAFCAAYYQITAAQEFQTYYSHENVTSKIGTRSKVMKIAVHMLLSCADSGWESKLKMLGHHYLERRDDAYVCQDLRGKVWTATMCVLLGISGFATSGVIYWQFGDILAFSDGVNYLSYKEWRMKEMRRSKRRYGLSSVQRSPSTSPSVSLNSLDYEQRYERQRLDSGEDRLFSQYTVGQDQFAAVASAGMVSA